MSITGGKGLLYRLNEKGERILVATVDSVEITRLSDDVFLDVDTNAIRRHVPIRGTVTGRFEMKSHQQAILALFMDSFVPPFVPPEVDAAVKAMKTHFEELAAGMSFNADAILRLQQAFSQFVETHTQRRLQVIDWAALVRDVNIQALKREQPFWTRDWRKGGRK